MVIWLIGQPKSGKSTIAAHLEDALGSKCIAVIDGDDLRKGCRNVDYSKEGRLKNIKMAQEMVASFDQPGRYVIVAVVAPYKKIREEFKNKNNVKEIYLFSERVDANKVNEFEPPEKNALFLDTTRYGISLCVKKILNFCGASSEMAA